MYCSGRDLCDLFDLCECLSLEMSDIQLQYPHRISKQFLSFVNLLSTNSKKLKTKKPDQRFYFLNIGSRFFMV